MNDPTYVKSQIDDNPVWALAFRLSEVDNDAAPVGWFRYCHLARWLLATFELLEKTQELSADQATRAASQAAEAASQRLRTQLRDDLESFKS